tara:strand:- start:171 stop:368 length:198 start_codon:yes stop_codon:yes gene_type:complete
MAASDEGDLNHKAAEPEKLPKVLPLSDIMDAHHLDPIAILFRSPSSDIRNEATSHCAKIQRRIQT